MYSGLFERPTCNIMQTVIRQPKNVFWLIRQTKNVFWIIQQPKMYLRIIGSQKYIMMQQLIGQSKM